MSGAAALMRLAQLPAQAQQKEDAATAPGKAGAPKVWCGGGVAGVGVAHLIPVTPHARYRRYKVKSGYKLDLLDATCSMPQSNQAASFATETATV